MNVLQNSPPLPLDLFFLVIPEQILISSSSNWWMRSTKRFLTANHAYQWSSTCFSLIYCLLNQLNGVVMRSRVKYCIINSNTIFFLCVLVCYSLMNINFCYSSLSHHLLYTNLALLGQVGLGVAMSVCMPACLRHRVQFFSRPLIGPQITWPDSGLSLVNPPSLPYCSGWHFFSQFICLHFVCLKASF